MSKARGLADLGNVYNDGALSNRNLIINGAMQVAQRGTSYSGSSFAGYFTVDRFRLDTNSSGTLTTSQDSDAPVGFGSSYKIDCTVSDASPDYTSFYTQLEGQDVQSIGKGTADAKEVTVSFWVKTNLVGTYPLNLRDVDNNRWCYLSYEVDTAGTWEYKTVTFPADTTGSLDNDASNSLTLEWWFSAGASYTGTTPTSSWVTRDDNKRADLLTVNMGSSTSNYINITGVQLEVGDTATPFEHRSYGDELARCQRYFFMLASGDEQSMPTGSYYSSTLVTMPVQFPVTMRSAPSLDSPTGTDYYGIYRNGAFDSFTSFSAIDRSSVNGATLDSTNRGASGTAGHSGPLKTDNASAYVAFDAEL